MSNSIDLNADLGEGSGTSRLAEDSVLLGLVSSANIACGFHAGDITSMKHTVRCARDRGVSVGAHPSYPDIAGFGRRELGLDPDQIRFHVVAQLRMMADVCDSEGVALAHVKPHGALYNRASRDGAAADAIVAAMREVDPALTLLGLAHSAMERSAMKHGTSFIPEAFVDRGYAADSTLVPRGQPGDVIHDAESAAERALRLVRDKLVTATTGEDLRIETRSLCVHGDNPSAVQLLQAVRQRLNSAGITVEALRR